MTDVDIKIWTGDWIIKNRGWNKSKTIFIGEFKNNINNTSVCGTWYGKWKKNIFRGFFKNNKGNIKYIERIGEWDNQNKVFTGKYNKNKYENIKYNFDKFILAQQNNINAINNIANTTSMSKYLLTFIIGYVTV